MPYSVELTVKRLKEVIEKAGYTYEQLEKKTGVSRSTLQRYANGVTTKIPIDAIQKIAEAVGVDAEYILGWDDTNTEILKDDSLYILTRKAKKLTPDQRNKLIQLSEMLFKEAFDDDT